MDMIVVVVMLVVKIKSDELIQKVDIISSSSDNYISCTLDM